ncbi:putative F-box protein At1g50870 [Olea europaea var. sylvestris]|uniref:putative F-box protein At1g50870 n=1 Tax=Olea europaea var. sylvestris TaxID=158386 RepID=UPI000C1D3EAC|nr:putative F-box protein At1g50870 [Olea europaea var. sylvestris]
MLKKKPSTVTPSPPLSLSPPPSPYQNDAVSEDAFAMMGPLFPSDLITSILSRLPVKSLGKFKCVSRQWLETITDPYFVSTHRTFSLNNPNLLLLKKTPVLQEAHKKKCTRIDVCSLNFDGSSKNLDFSLYLNDDAECIEMLPSKWDIICFVSENGFYVCNPSTQEMVKLPEASCCTSGEVNAGMGYLKQRDEYVLVHLFDKSLDMHVDNYIGCEVLRLSDGKECKWKMVEANCPFTVRGWGVLVNNVFYWMFWDVYTHPSDDAIISFDLEKEEFGTVLPPEGCFDPHGLWSLVELGGNLCLVDNATRPFTMDIWVMKDYNNQKWVREYSIDLNGYSNDMLKFIIPLEFRDGKILMDAKQESLDCYDVENKCVKRMDHLISGEWTWLRLYNESFFSLGS